ncbi:MAG: site-specific DNA-methyltransferase [Treponema sp.]|nr:site-specific DNA-methyltransferase [Treponema sp.]
MSTNLSKQKREATIEKISQIRSFLQNSPDENAQKLLGFLGDLENDLATKKYGLVFEEHREAIDEILENNVPVLTEETTLSIDNGGIQNFLIEGDNLASLKLLEKTHRGKIDLIYIDPPYNRGKDDFIYDDDYIDRSDTFRHSKWVSFMEKRLNIAKKLLTEEGTIFISCDDNEQAALKLLCDTTFGEENFIAIICRQTIKGGSRSENIRSVHDYVLIYSKNKNFMTPFTGEKKDELKLDLVDKKGPYTKGRELNKWGAGSRREDSPTMWFPIKGPNGVDVYPIRNDGSEGRWRWGKKKLLKAVEEDDVIFEQRDDGTYIAYEKVRGLKTDTKQFTTWFSDNYINAKGSEVLKKIFNTMMSVFDFAKPVELISDLLFMGNNTSATVLDFFAGSGTTGQAVLELNEKDGGTRKFILCTNNQNNIARDITYERIKTVITGKRKDNTEYSDGFEASLKYYKVDFINISDKLYYEYADELLKHVKELVELENAINFDKDKSIAICLSEEEIDDFTEKLTEMTELKKIYLGHDIQLTDKQESLFENLGVEVIQIPEYYYDED